MNLFYRTLPFKTEYSSGTKSDNSLLLRKIDPSIHAIPKGGKASKSSRGKKSYFKICYKFLPLKSPTYIYTKFMALNTFIQYKI